MALLDIDRDTLAHTMTAIGDADRTLALPCDVADGTQVRASIDAVANSMESGSMRWSTMPHRGVQTRP